MIAICELGEQLLQRDALQIPLTKVVILVRSMKVLRACMLDWQTFVKFRVRWRWLRIGLQARFQCVGVVLLLSTDVPATSRNCVVLKRRNTFQVPLEQVQLAHDSARVYPRGVPVPEQRHPWGRVHRVVGGFNVGPRMVDV